MAQGLFDPADKITIRDIPNEQKETVGGLVQPTVSQHVGGYWAASDMLRLSAGAAALVEAAPVIVPIASQLGAGGAATHLRLNIVPRHGAVPLHIVGGNPVRDPLEAETFVQPFEQKCCVVPLNCRTKVPTSLAGGDFIDEIKRAGKAAHSMD